MTTTAEHACAVCSAATDEALPVLGVPLCSRERNEACSAKYWRALPPFYRTLVVDHCEPATAPYSLSKIGRATGAAMVSSRYVASTGEVVHDTAAPQHIGFESLDMRGVEARNKSDRTEIMRPPVVLTYEDKSKGVEDTGVFYAMFEALPGEGKAKQPRAARYLQSLFRANLADAVSRGRVNMGTRNVAEATLKEFFAKQDAELRKKTSDDDGSAATAFLAYFGDVYADRDTAVFAWVGSSVGALVRNDTGRIIEVTRPHTESDDREERRVDKADVSSRTIRKQFERNTRALGVIDPQLRRGIIAEPSIAYVSGATLGELDNEQEGGKKSSIDKAVTLVIMSRELWQAVDNTNELAKALRGTANATPTQITEKIFSELRGLFGLGFSADDSTLHMIVVKFFDLPGLFNIQFEEEKPVGILKLPEQVKRALDRGVRVAASATE